jgi:hypothetical protein
MTTRSLFCGAELDPTTWSWVRLLDDERGFVCCPTVCPSMREAIEAQRRESAARRHRLGLPLSVA